MMDSSSQANSSWPANHADFYAEGILPRITDVHFGQDRSGKVDPLAHVEFITADSPQAVGQKAAALVRDALVAKPNASIVFPTGETPKPMYAALRQLTKNGQINWANAKLYHLDEYVADPTLGLKPEQTYKYYLDQELFGLPQLKHTKKNYVADYLQHPEDYERQLLADGGADVVVLGIGRNGHIAFLEPGFDPLAPTGKVTLAPKTIETNFPNPNEGYAKEAVSLGFELIRTADHVILLATDDAKKGAILRQALDPEQAPTNQIPASLLKTMGDKKITVITDFTVNQGA